MTENWPVLYLLSVGEAKGRKHLPRLFFQQVSGILRCAAYYRVADRPVHDQIGAAEPSAFSGLAVPGKLVLGQVKALGL